MLFDYLRRELVDVETKIEHGATPPLTKRKKAIMLQLDNIVYPILTLPSEITSEIFVQSVGSPYTMSHHPPIIFIRICRVWRTIALTTPQLWTTLCLHFNGNDYPPEGLARFVAQFTDRAKNLPLSSTFHGFAGGIAGHDLAAILERQAPRLRDLVLSMEVLDFPILSKERQFPALEKLTLGGFCFARSDSDVPNMMHTFLDAPQLRQVVLHTGVTREHFLLPWSQLVKFAVATISTADCLQILRDAPMLKTCRFSGIYDAGPVGSPATAHSLEELVIVGWGNLLNFLDLPHLRTLSLDHVDTRDISIEFFARSSESLQEVTYTGRVDSDSDSDSISIDWLRPMDQLTTLTLTTIPEHFATALLRALNREVDDRFLPHLRHLEMTRATYTVDAPVVAALWSRCDTTSTAPNPDAVQLESLRLLCVRSYPDSTLQYRWENAGEDIDWDALADLGRAGMDVYLGSRQKNFIWDWFMPQHIVFSP
ncbi:hypothetical protein DFH08DRAFT_303764 [Mycena albidolilacea]|uniref:F-box domain-containing protein n=1 Tax=Mycena albidolilacea TaxID=1033008 RepID=A0AAD6ZQK9_9AGAR|nr:hypothetical protein DFH08DRAFT_303764 [Mycena albidolilacea]